MIHHHHFILSAKMLEISYAQLELSRISFVGSRGDTMNLGNLNYLWYAHDP